MHLSVDSYSSDRYADKSKQKKQQWKFCYLGYKVTAVVKTLGRLRSNTKCTYGFVCFKQWCRWTAQYFFPSK